MPKLVIGEPPALDARLRRAAQTPTGRAAARVMSPLFPVGLPGGYLAIAYATAHWLHRNNRSGGSSIVASAWLGWLLHRAFKVALVRRRPPHPRVRARFDSFPSGHTTGATALALTTAIVLRREHLISRRRAALIGVGAPLLMGVYRVVADDHWATDVVGGWALGSAVAFLSLRDPPRPRRARHRVRREAPMSAESNDRRSYADGRARTARPSVR
jgi:undecaprenyl-diphosphatase